MVTNETLQNIADAYCVLTGLPAPVRGHNVPVDHTTARAICLEYENLPNVDHSALTRQCYGALAQEVMAQFRFLVARGYSFQPWQEDGQPYQNSAEMRADVAQNKHLSFFTGGEIHPFLSAYAVTLDGVDCCINDIFRAVHDIFGHAAEGYSFAQRGEENAWIHHSMMFTADARWALTSETRGQNSWVNESDENAGKPAAERAFAVQKAALLPYTYTLTPLEIEVVWLIPQYAI